MTSLDIRNNSAVMKRAEQLKRWEESDTNQQPPVPRPEPGNRIKFSSGCIFLAACLASDKEEVLRMLEQGADINTANVDGLTALHQACIDDNLEMVEFLVEQGADINRQDNEGWTPLHATASCGFVSIARYLVEHGADVAAVNSDGDLAVDLAVDIQHLPMIDFMQKMVAEQQIDCAKARQAEEQQMLSDAKKWLRSDASEVDRPHPKTGATALHVAAAKGYTKVLSLLLAGRANVDAQDNDGWTPLHAAAHWGQKESAEMLLDAMADMDLRNYAAQTCIDVADRKMVKFLEEYRASNKRMKRRPSSQISRISDTIENHIDKTPTKIIRVEVRPENNKDHVNDDKSSMQKTTNETPATEDEAPWRRNNVTRVRSTNESPIKNQVPDNEVSKTNNATTETDVILRRTQSFENDEKKSPPISPSVTSSPATAVATTTSTSSPAAVTTPIRRSFVPPVRDEESETQRKAHAKRVRETRRSTQGVTLDEIKSAEELVKKKNSTMNNNNNNNSSSNEMQVNVTSETTTTATTTTTTPIITTTIEQDLSKEQEQTQPQLQTAETSEIETEKEQEQEQENDKETNASQTNEVSERTEDADEDITASFTIIAPSSATKARPSSLIVTATTSTSQEFGHNEEEVSATFVMPPRKESRTPTPTTENVETTLVVRPVLKDNSPTRDELDKKPNRFPEEDGNEKYSKSSTHNKENENHENKKTEPPPLADVELSAETTTTTTQQPTMKMTQSQRAQSNERIRTAFFNPLPLVTQITTTTTPSNVSSNSAANSTTTTPTLDSPVRLRDKRSLFDIDNASSQTLADKLRSEANKYWNDERRFAGDHSALHDSSLERDTSASPLLGGVAGASAGGSNASYNYNSRRSLDSSSLPNSPLHTRDREAGGCSDSSSTTSTVTSVGGGGGSSCGGVGGSFNNILAADRRPSWRLKFDSGSKFKLEDATSGNTYPPNNSTIIPSAPAVIAAANSMSQRRVNSSNNTISSSNQSLNSIGRPVSAPPTSNLSNNSTTASSNTSTTSSSSHSNNDDKLNDNSSSSSGFGSYSSRRSNTATSTTSLTPDSQSTGTSTSNTVNTSTTNLHSNNDDKDNDKENDNRSALATQAVIQRRRKPKRRSTGVVHIDMDELDPEKQDSANDNEEKEKESGSETRPSRSRVGSTASTVSVSTSTSATDDKKTRDKTENSGDNIDYKALWEAAKLENDKLKQQLKKKDEDVVQTRATLERFANATTKNSLSEIEKRERRAMERKLSELEEELKLLQKLKNENERLRAENRALTRVVSKLTSSAQSQLSKSKQ
ncbi:protein phosphatase 1 regulatory subunit 12B isoform X10 [Calliphora vicina]|uniref:protein phosphatase 1 regulatory subunit 12B isoform X10 n=1 Tax=Calliphora vicina TaxID=7373 RepID=UPI00325B7AF6